MKNSLGLKLRNAVLLMSQSFHMFSAISLNIYSVLRNKTLKPLYTELFKQEEAHKLLLPVATKPN